MMFGTRALIQFLYAVCLVTAAGPPLSASPVDAELIEESGYSALEAGRTEQARRLFERALEQDSRSAAATAGLGFLEMRAWEFRRAERRFATALEYAPGDPVIGKALADARFWAALKEGDAALSQGLTEKAHERYQAALAVKPGDPSVLERLVKMGSAAGHAAEAPVEAPVSTETPAATDTVGAVVAPELTPAELVREAERDLDGGNFGAAQSVLVEQGKDQAQWATVRNLVRRGLTQPLGEVELRTLLAAAYLGLDDVPNGIRVVRRTEADLRARGRALPTHLEVQAARLILRRNPFDHELHSRLASVWRRAGLPAPAVDDLRELRINWSVTWARKSIEGGRLDRAMEMLERARRSYPSEPRIRAAIEEAQRANEPVKRRPRWRADPGVIVIHGLSDRPTAVAESGVGPRAPRRLSGGITIAGV